MFKISKQIKLGSSAGNDVNKITDDNKDSDKITKEDAGSAIITFVISQPGQQFLHLKRKFHIILVVNVKEGSLCRIKDIESDNKNTS